MTREAENLGAMVWVAVYIAKMIAKNHTPGSTEVSSCTQAAEDAVQTFRMRFPALFEAPRGRAQWGD
jgi:hypothetical protein